MPPVDGADEWQILINRLARDGGHDVEYGFDATAQPSGPIVREVYEALRDELLAKLAAAAPIDIVLLLLHGAMVADGYPDCEGDIITRVRAMVGKQIPIGVELDPHCHFTEAMLKGADIIIAFKEYPHTDSMERFEELWALSIALAEGKIRPTTAVYDCRMVSFWHTTREPMRSFVAEMKALERAPRVLSVSFGHGFPWGDVPEGGAKVWVVTDNAPELGADIARQLGKKLWSLRESTRGHEVTLDEALRRAVANTDGKPLLLADIADNPGGGASGDSTFILRALLNERIGNAAVAPFWDLGAIQVCREAGVGARFELRVGGKCGPLSGEPVDVRVTVRAIAEAHSQSMLANVRSDCGPSVWVSTDDGIDLVLISIRQQAFGADLLTGLGVTLEGKRLIIVKSSQHFYASFAPLASDVLYVDTPGMLRSDFAAIPYRQRDLTFWPRVANPWGDYGDM